MTHGRPFDARRHLLSDADQPQSLWRTVSLVTGLRECARRDPDSAVRMASDERLADAMLGMAHELTDRGLDADTLVRYGLFPELVSGVVAMVLPEWTGAPVALGLVGEAPGEVGPVEVRERWIALLRPRLEAAGINEPSGAKQFDPRTVATIVGVVARATIPWIFSAPLDALLRLHPPADEPSSPVFRAGDDDGSLFRQYRWVVERFSETRLEDWSKDSLHLEYRWLARGGLPPCRLELMSDRLVTRTALEQEIAVRSVRPPTAPSEWEGVRQSLAVKMQRQAVVLLRDGRCTEAAALFEYAVLESPSDASAVNNLGFCLMPDDPFAAREHLERAAELGYRPAIINAYNRAVCALLLEDLGRSLRIAEEAWGLPVDHGDASLWRRGESGLEFVESADPRLELARLAHSAARALGRAELESLWADRLAA